MTLLRQGSGGQGLPRLLQEVADEAGLTAAYALAKEFGGIEIYIPKTLRDGHRLTEALGLRAARKVVELYGGGHVQIPLGPWAHGGQRHEAIEKLLEKGNSAPKVARALGCHVKTVRRHRARIGADDPRQLDLLR